MTNKEKSLIIRKELKENGYNTRDFKVSVKDCGYSTTVNITIKNPHVNRREVKNILNHHEVCERDERTFEVLEGANTYLFIEYERGIFKEVSQEWAATAKGVMLEQAETISVFDGLTLINWERKGRLELRQNNKNEYVTLKVDDFNHLCELIYKFAEFGTIAA